MELCIEITYPGDLPTEDELAVRSDVEEWLLENDVGEVVDTAAAAGRMQIFIEVTDEDKRQAVKRIREFLDNEGITERASVREIVPETQLYDEDV